MAAAFTTATRPHVLADPARDHVEAFEARAHAMLAPVLRSSDATPGMRSVMQSLLGAQLQSKAQIETLMMTLDHLAAIVEMVPDLQRRIAVLEAKNHGD